ncbi:sulfatase-like hydrolase/transferase [Rubinisphaera sp.]|uniref:sulfatase-like hydrolase/transferase n=1 Tax=Rubinisphaera sp. TaxID=2024857 RepID=UPI000C1219E2|nr:sulfatase-like hydrolase/transferase [Rubinisphaera sp.]MBV11521.1 hypothetical protein [Rubinisphaera sp.]|tara:strand:- start:1978 stop:3330 length:1353 start_codon:yes stop_codon:yes gene_type:complete
MSLKFLFIYCLLQFACLYGQNLIEAANQPNIVMIFTDDQGYHDVGCYGSEISTPNIDRLATEGLKLTEFYAASSICTPSRFGLLTGQFAHRSQDHLLGALMFLSEKDAERGIHSHELTYVSRLADAGYQTALVGKWHLGHGTKDFWPTKHGFDSFFGHTGGCVDFFTLNYGIKPDWYRGEELVEVEGYATDVITDEAVRVLHGQADSKKPLYLHIAYNAPHFGKGYDHKENTTVNVMQPKPEDLQKVTEIEDPLRRSFAAKVVGLDEGIGRILQTLDDLKMTENTLIIFMTDHGGDPDYGGSNLPLRGGKATLYEGGLKVPCLIRWPGKIEPGSVSDDVTCAVDFYPTLLEIAGSDLGKQQLDGISLVPVLKGNSLPTRPPLVFVTGSHQELKRKSWKAVRDGKWKWIQPPGKEGQLYNLESDPNEEHNIADKHPQIAERLNILVQEQIQ